MNALEKSGTRLKRQFESTVATWKNPNDIPKFGRLALSLRGDIARIVVGTIGSSEDWPNLLYHFLNGGTAERWAVLSKNWVSKTIPGFIGSGPGQGYVRLKGREQMNKAGYEEPMPGIEARNWTKEIAEIEFPFFKEDLHEAIKKALQHK
jgi:hypothetical protein